MRDQERVRCGLVVTALAGALGVGGPAQAQTSGSLPASPLGVIGTSPMGVVGASPLAIPGTPFFAPTGPSALGIVGTSALGNPATVSGFVDGGLGFIVPGFVPGSGTGFAGGVIFPGWGSVWEFGYYPAWLGPAAVPPLRFAYGNGVPTLGVNTPPLLAWGRGFRTRGYRASPAPDTDVPAASRRESERRDAVRASASRTSARIERRLEQVMASRPLTSGRVRAMGATGARVELREGGRTTTIRYALKDVYFVAGKQILDATSAAKRLKPGDLVIVPAPSGAGAG